MQPVKFTAMLRSMACLICRDCIAPFTTVGATQVRIVK